MRLIADLIRGKRVNSALNQLKFDSKYTSGKLKIIIVCCFKLAGENKDAKIEDSDLYIKNIYVDGGRMIKRLRTAPQGRAHRIRKRSNHVTLVLDNLEKINKKEDGTKN